MAIQPTKEMIQAIHNYKQGQRQEFHIIYTNSLPYLSKCILNVVNRTAPNASEELVQDILQDTYMSIAEKLDTLQNEESFFQWAGQIATNHALRTWSKNARHMEFEQSQEELLYEIPDEQFIPEDILQSKEKQHLIRQMLQELPTGQYLCLVEYFYNELKETEIAEKLDMPLGTVKTNLFRAKKKLKQIVQTHEKKHGVKLYSMSWLLIVLFWEDIKEVCAGTGAVFAESAGAASSAGTGLTAGGSAAGVTTGTSTAIGTGTVAATGLGAKIIAGVVAAAVLAGSAIGIKTMVRNNIEDTQTDPPVSNLQSDHYAAEESGNETVPLETEPEQPVQKEMLVVDAYGQKIILPDGKERCYHIPMINLETCSEFNQMIYDACYSSIEYYVYDCLRHYNEPYFIHNTSYISGHNDDAVSIVMKEGRGQSSYKVYNVNKSDGSILSSEQILQLYGLTQDEFEELVKQTFTVALDKITSGLYSEEYLQQMKEETLSDGNIAKSIPFIGPDGDLCFVGQRLEPGIGSGHCYVVYNTHSNGSVFAFDCQMDHSDTCQIFNKDISEEEAYKFACEYWGVTPEEAEASAPEFSIGCFGIETYGNDRYYKFALRQLITEGSSSWATTLDIVYVDTWTGKCKMNPNE